MSEWSIPGRTRVSDGHGLVRRTARPSRAPGAAQLPLLPVCERALAAARALPELRQILILGLSPGHQKPAFPEAARLTLHSVCLGAGERVGHPDLLLALSMGFTHVLWQQEGNQEASLIQLQERQVCEYLGGQGRISLFSGEESLQAILADLAFLPLENAPVPAAAPPVRNTRRETARACASFLLRHVSQPIPLPDCAPYGRVQIDRNACTDCHSCVWMCPTEALSIGQDQGQARLEFTESSCIQCGMCRSACPQGAIELQARFNLDIAAERPRAALTGETCPCRICGAAVAPRGMLDRIIDRLLSGRFSAASTEVTEMISTCSECLAAAKTGSPRPRAADGGRLDS